MSARSIVMLAIVSSLMVLIAFLAMLQQSPFAQKLRQAFGQAGKTVTVGLAARHLQRARQQLAVRNFKGAEEEIKQALRLDPQNSNAHMLLVVLYVQQNRFAELDRHLQKVKTALSPPKAALLIRQAAEFIGMEATRIGFEEKDVAQAEELYQKALQLDPDNATLCNNYGYLLAERGIKLDYAEKLIRKALEKEPSNAAFVDSMGWVFYQKRKYREAVRELRRAVRLDPNHAELQYHLGMALWKMGDEDGALKCFKKALQIDPNYEPARKAKEELEGGGGGGYKEMAKLRLKVGV